MIRKITKTYSIYKEDVFALITISIVVFFKQANHDTGGVIGCYFVSELAVHLLVSLQHVVSVRAIRQYLAEF